MKIVLHKTYGSFSLPLPYAETKDLNFYDDSFEVRTDPELMEYVTAHPNTRLEVVEFPDEATDFNILEYDGLESIIYVINGKLHYA